MGSRIKLWMWNVEPAFYYKFKDARVEIDIDNGNEKVLVRGKGLHLFALLHKLFRKGP